LAGQAGPNELSVPTSIDAAVTGAFRGRPGTPLAGAITQAKILQMDQRPARAKIESEDPVEHWIGPGDFPVKILGGHRWSGAIRIGGRVLETVLWCEVCELSDTTPQRKAA
jgi:hypothetical protein